MHIHMCAHKEYRVGLWVSCFILLHVIALKQCASLNLELAGGLWLVQMCLAFYVSTRDLNSGAHACSGVL